MPLFKSGTCGLCPCPDQSCEKHTVPLRSAQLCIKRCRQPCLRSSTLCCNTTGSAQSWPFLIRRKSQIFWKRGCWVTLFSSGDSMITRLTWKPKLKTHLLVQSNNQSTFLYCAIYEQVVTAFHNWAGDYSTVVKICVNLVNSSNCKWHSVRQYCKWMSGSIKLRAAYGIIQYIRVY